MSSDYRGQLIVVSSPSGAGKTTLCSRLRSEFPDLGFSISYTTRSPRGAERDGVDYHFATRDRFDAMVAGGEFAEYATVHGNMYGTAVAPVEAALTAGRDLLFDIDFQGGQQLVERFAEDVVLIFVLPPSLAELERRLRSRATDADDVIERRLRVAKAEMDHFVDYHYVVVNDDLDTAYAALRSIYVAGRHRTASMRRIAQAVVGAQAAGRPGSGADCSAAPGGIPAGGKRIA